MIYVNLFFNVSINFNIILFLFNDNLLKWIQMTLIIWGWILRNTFKFNTRDLIWRRMTVQINFYFYKNSFILLGCIWLKDVVNEDAYMWERAIKLYIQFLFRCWFCPWALWIMSISILNLIECTFVNSLYYINCHSYFLYTGIRIGTYSEILRSYKIHRSYKLLWGSQS